MGGTRGSGIVSSEADVCGIRGLRLPILWEQVE